MTVFDVILANLRELREADARHQRDGDALLQRYYDFLRSRGYDSRRSINGSGLRLRRCRDASRRLCRIAWTRRVYPKYSITVSGRKGLTATLREPFRKKWVFTYARDWHNREKYAAFDRERCLWNRRASAIADSRRRLRLALANKWSGLATEADWGRARILVHDYGLEAREVAPLAGAAVLRNQLLSIEGLMLDVVHAYWRAFDRSATVTFEPHVSHRAVWRVRIQWGFRTGESGGRAWVAYMPPPTDREMRRRHVARMMRRKVGEFLRQLRALDRAYQGHARWIQNLLSRVGRAVKEVAPRPPKVAS